MNKEERVVKYINSADDFVVDGKRYCENDFYNDVEDLAKENQSLKKEVEYLRRSIERKEETITELECERAPYVNEYVENLKKQLEEANEKILLLQASEPMLEYKKALEENQQKEFIEYITSYIELLNNKPDLVEEGQKDILEEILLKYKEIIGE